MPESRRRDKVSGQVTGEKILAEVQKNATEIIRVRRTEFNGVDLLDVRVWTAP